MALAHPRNNAEQDALIQFKQEIDDLREELTFQKIDDYFLLRWLRARDLNVIKAKEMLSNYLEFRSSYENELNGILEWEAPSSVTKNVEYEMLGADEDGRVVLWLPVGTYNPKTIVQNDEADLLRRYFHQLVTLILTKMSEQVALGKKSSQLVVVADMDGLTFSKVSHLESIRMCLGILREFEAYYPELLYKAYVVNAHWVFPIAFNLIKPVLSPNTLGKIEIYGRNERNWKLALNEKIPQEILPKEYGGTGPIVLDRFRN